ncbi:MAG: hypothetical protein AB8H86_17025 [Polyangiales bacterium]
MNFSIQYLDSGVVLFTIGGRPSAPEASSALKETSAAFKSWAYPRCVVFDLSVEDVKADVRRLVTNWRQENARLIPSAVHGAAYVVRSPVVRGVLTALNWVTGTNIQNTVYVETRAEALRRCEQWSAELMAPTRV